MDANVPIELGRHGYFGYAIHCLLSRNGVIQSMLNSLGYLLDVGIVRSKFDVSSAFGFGFTEYRDEYPPHGH